MYQRFVYSFKDIFAQRQNVQLTLGVIDDEGELTNVSTDPNLTVSIISDNAKTFILGNKRYVQANEAASVVFRLTYGDLQSTLSIVATNFPIPVSTDDSATQLLFFQPRKSYPTNQSSNWFSLIFAAATIYNGLSESLVQIFLDNYPPYTSNLNWQTQLNNYYLAWQDSFNFGLVVKTFRNIRTQRTNLFDTTRLITTYIYARLGLDLYVYIADTTLTDNFWTLDVSDLDENTILPPENIELDPLPVYIKTFETGLTQDFQNELLLFIQKIMPINVVPELILTPDFAQFDIFLAVGDVYDHDPRLLAPFALKYDGSAIEDVVALINPYNPYFLIGIEYVPSGGVYEQTDPPITLEAVAKYNADGTIYELPITNQATFTSSDTNVLSLTNNIATIEGIGESIITATYEGFTDSHIFLISPEPKWILDISDLDDTTVLA